MQVDRNCTKGHEEEGDNIDQVPKGKEVRPKETRGEAVLREAKLDFLHDEVKHAREQKHICKQILERPEASVQGIQVEHCRCRSQAECQNKENVDDSVNHCDRHGKWAEDSFVQRPLDNRSHGRSGDESCIQHTKDADQTADAPDGIIKPVTLLPEMTKVASVDHFRRIGPGKLPPCHLDVMQHVKVVLNIQTADALEIVYASLGKLVSVILFEQANSLSRSVQ